MRDQLQQCMHTHATSCRPMCALQKLLLHEAGLHVIETPQEWSYSNGSMATLCLSDLETVEAIFEAHLLALTVCMVFGILLSNHRIVSSTNIDSAASRTAKHSSVVKTPTINKCAKRIRDAINRNATGIGNGCNRQVHHSNLCLCVQCHT